MWSPSHGTAMVALGVVLLVNPLYVGALHLDDPNWYRYEPAPVEFTDDGIQFPEERFAGGIDDDVACLNREYRVCQLEHYVNRTGGVPYPERMAAGPGSGYRYAYIDDEFYRVQPFGVGGDGTLGLEAIPREEALGGASTRLDRAEPGVRTAVETGAIETREPLDGANQLVRDGGDYYVVYRTAARTVGSAYDRKKLEGEILEGGLMVLLGAAGLAAILRGQRRRLRRRWR